MGKFDWRSWNPSCDTGLRPVRAHPLSRSGGACHKCAAWLIATTIALLLIPIARAAPPSSGDVWTLTTPDLRTDTVNITSIDDAGVHCGGGRAIPYDQIVQLDRPGASAVALAPAAAAGSRGVRGNALPPRLFLCLTSGDRFAGAPAGMSGEQIRWKAATLGGAEIAVPLREVNAILRAGQPWPQPSSEPRNEDVVVLANGDTVHGILSELSENELMIQPAGAAGGGQAQSVSLDALISVYLASTSGGGGGGGGAAATSPAAQSGQRRFRVTLADGSAITTRALSMNGREFRLAFAGGASSAEPRTIPASAVASIEQLNGPLVWLSALTPSESVQTPYFGDRSMPARLDRAVDGDPIRFAGKEYTRGIGVHAYSRLSFPLDPAFKAFRTQYAIDGDGLYADVTVRVKLDDRLVEERPHVKPGALAPVLVVPLNGEKTLTLEVDYGENYDVQDRFNWVQPALLRIRPAPPPSTTAPVATPVATPAPATQP
jgi:hypothetical protein